MFCVAKASFNGSAGHHFIYLARPSRLAENASPSFPQLGAGRNEGAVGRRLRAASGPNAQRLKLTTLVSCLGASGGERGCGIALGKRLAMTPLVVLMRSIIGIELAAFISDNLNRQFQLSRTRRSNRYPWLQIFLAQTRLPPVWSRVASMPLFGLPPPYILRQPPAGQFLASNRACWCRCALRPGRTPKSRTQSLLQRLQNCRRRTRQTHEAGRTGN